MAAEMPPLLCTQQGWRAVTALGWEVLNPAPPRPYAEVTSQVLQNALFCVNRVTAGVPSSGEAAVCPYSTRTGVGTKGGNVPTCAGRRPCGDEGRNWGEAAKAKVCAKSPVGPRSWERGLGQIPPPGFRKHPPLSTP